MHKTLWIITVQFEEETDCWHSHFFVKGTKERDKMLLEYQNFMNEQPTWLKALMNIWINLCLIKNKKKQWHELIAHSTFDFSCLREISAYQYTQLMLMLHATKDRGFLEEEILASLLKEVIRIRATA